MRCHQTDARSCFKRPSRERVNSGSGRWTRKPPGRSREPKARPFPSGLPNNESVGFFAGGQLKRIDVASRLRAEPGGGAAEHPRWCVERLGHHPLYPLRHRTAVSRASRWREGRGRHRGHRTTPGPPVPAVPARWRALSVLRVRPAREPGHLRGCAGLDEGHASARCGIGADIRAAELRAVRATGDCCWPSRSTSTRASPSAIRCRWRGRSRLRRELSGASRCPPRRPDPSPTAPTEASASCDGWTGPGARLRSLAVPTQAIQAQFGCPPTAAWSRRIGWSAGTPTCGCSRPGVTCGSDSQRIRRGSSTRSGLPTGAASFSARRERVSSTSTSDPSAARQPRHWCWSLPKARTRSTGHWTATGSCLRCRVPQTPAISGRCRSRARRSRSPSRTPRPTNRSRSFLQTAVGSPTSRTRADETKSTSSAFPYPAAGRRSPPAVARFRSGTVTDSRSSISTPATVSPAWPCCGTECRRKSASSRGIPWHCSRCRSGGRTEPTPDGQRFLISEITKPPSPITILLNWKPRP